MKWLLWMVLLMPVPAFAQSKGVITGRITSSGAPAQGIRVAAMPVDAASTRSTTTVLESIAATDAAGNFRIENITPGRYYVIAGLVNSPTYFPGTGAKENATILAVTAGVPVNGIEFSIGSSSVPHRVSGRVTGITDGRLMRQITLLPRSTAPAAGRMSVNTTIGTDGTFSFPSVSPGDYSVNVAGLILPQPILLTVADSDISSLDIVVRDPDAVTRVQGLTTAWSRNGSWRALAWDEKTSVLQAGLANRRAEIDSTGKTVGDAPLPSSPTIRIARISGGAPVFLSFGTWSQSVKAHDVAGTQLWSYPEAGQGIDDVWPADLDGDGIDEVIVGFNGNTGMHVLNAEGKLLWQSTGIGNVWHVAAGDVTGDGKPRVVTTSALGAVHIFNVDGRDRRDLRVALYANMVRVAKLSPQDSRATIVVAGTARGNPANNFEVAAVMEDGAVKWSLQLAVPTPSAYSMTIARGKPWVAVGLQGGLVYVVDAAKGTVLGSVDGQGFSPEIAWMTEPGTDVPILVVSTSAKLNAYRVSQ